jgi:hypothetical protein
MDLLILGVVGIIVIVFEYKKSKINKKIDAKIEEVYGIVRAQYREPLNNIGK